MRSSAISLQMRYDSEALYFDEWVRTSKRKQLEEKLLQLVLPAFQLGLGHLRSGTLEKFKEAFGKALSGGEGSSSAARDCIKLYMAQFDEGCEDAVIEQAKWDTSRVREKLKRDIDVHIAAVRETKLSELTKAYEMKLNDALSGSVEALLDEANDKTWPAIRKLLQCETEFAISGFSNAVTGFELDEQTNEKMITHLRDYARGMVESKIKQEAGKVLSRMKDRFETLFSRDADSMPRVWTGKEDIRGITKTERSASLKLLSAMAAIRLDNEADNIERSLSLALLDPKSNSTVTDRSITSAADPLAASTWEEVPSTKTVITPVQCKNLWRQFKSETEYSVAQAMAAQEAARRTNNLLPPPWAIVAMVILGFNEFMKLLRNPLYLGVIFVGYLIIKAVWVQLDVSGEFRHGALPGIISLTNKFLPTIMNLLKKLAEAGQAPRTKDHHKNPALGSKSFGGRVGTSTSMSSTGSSVVIQDETTEYSSTSKED